MKITRGLSTFRYLSAAVFLCAVFYAAYREQPLLADPTCQINGNERRVVYHGPNPGLYPTEAQCVSYWNGQTPSNACSTICGSAWENDWLWDACSDEFDPVNGYWSWYAGHVICKQKEIEGL